MGKCSALKSKLPAFVEEESYQQKVDDAKQFILAGAENAEAANVNRLAALFSERKRAKEALEESISELNVEIEALSQMLCEALEDQDMQKVTLSSGALVYLQDTPYPQVKDKEALIAWIKKHKMNSLLGVNYQTLKGLTNELLVGGKPAPDGVEVFLKTSARLRNGASADE
jgi:phage host-nuclease inhibitor protein Gam